MSRALAVAVLALGGCSASDPQAAADKFMDLYFIEFDQHKLLPLTVGLAHDKIERELRLVDHIRNDLGYGPSQARSRMHYRRLSKGVDGDKARLEYRVIIKENRDRLVLVSLQHQSSAWLVSNFVISEDPEPTPAPTGTTPGKQ